MENLLLLGVPILKHIRGMTKNKKSIFLLGWGGAEKRDLVAGEFENKSCHIFIHDILSLSLLQKGILS